MSQEIPPHTMRRTMVKSTVGHVKHTCCDLPDSKNPSHVYGLALPRDPENAGQVIGKWIGATPSPAVRSGRSFIETNKQAIQAGIITAGEARLFAVEHPEIVVKTPSKRRSGHGQSRDMVHGIKSKESEDFNALIQAKFTTYSPENEYYPDLSNMRIKGRLPQPRETKTSVLKDVRSYPMPQSRGELFKMSKFRNVGATMCTQPNAQRTNENYADDDYF